MSTYERLAEEDRLLRRTLADALEVLCKRAGFYSSHQATIAVGGLRLPSGQVVGLTQLLFRTSAKTYVVSLPTAVKFQAIAAEASRVETFDVFRLDGAIVESDGLVHLADGTQLRAVKVIPAPLPLQPQDLDWRIVHATVKAIGAEKHCYRRLTDAFSEEFVDCAKLRDLSPPSRKKLIYLIAKVDPELGKVSGQKIADTLWMFGIRRPVRRLLQTCAAATF
jgi:hypothetical protein